MWLSPGAGLASAEPGSVSAGNEPLGVTRGAQLAAASPLKAGKRMGNSQRNLLNRATRAGNRGGNAQNVRRVSSPRSSALRANGVTGVNRTGSSEGDGRLQGMGNHDYLRLTGQLSGQSCESIEGGVLVRRGC